jgi:hypothetical protein
MLWLNDAVIEILRQAVPVVSSITATAWGTARMASKGKSPKVQHVAMYSGAGWLGGYIVRSVAMRVIEGTSKALPTPSELSMPEPISTMGPTAGLPTGLPLEAPVGNHAGEVVAIPRPKKQPKLADVSARGENIAVQGTMDQSAMGSAYGG